MTSFSRRILAGVSAVQGAQGLSSGLTATEPGTSLPDLPGQVPESDRNSESPRSTSSESIQSAQLPARARRMTADEASTASEPLPDIAGCEAEAEAAPLRVAQEPDLQRKGFLGPTMDPIRRAQEKVRQAQKAIAAAQGELEEARGKLESEQAEERERFGEFPNEEKTCSVCLEDGFLLPSYPANEKGDPVCTHLYCNGCLKNVLEGGQAKAFPQCRAPFSKVQYTSAALEAQAEAKLVDAEREGKNAEAELEKERGKLLGK